jgi:hypothetical protein
MCVLQGMIHDWDGGSDENIQSAGTSNINTGIQGDKDPRTWDGVDFNRQWVTNWSEFQNGESESETETEHLYSYSYDAGGRVKLHGTVAALALTHASLWPSVLSPALLWHPVLSCRVSVCLLSCGLWAFGVQVAAIFRSPRLKCVTSLCSSTPSQRSLASWDTTPACEEQHITHTHMHRGHCYISAYSLIYSYL